MTCFGQKYSKGAKINSKGNKTKNKETKLGLKCFTIFVTIGKLEEMSFWANGSKTKQACDI